MYQEYNNDIYKIIKFLNLNVDYLEVYDQKIDEYLYEHYLISEEDYYRILSVKNNIEFRCLKDLKEGFEIYKGFKKEFYINNNLILIKNGLLFSVFVCETKISFIKNKMKSFFNKDLNYYLISKSDFNQLIDYSYNKEIAYEEYEINQNKVLNEEINSGYDIEILNYPVVKLLDKILEDSINQSASDIHIEPSETEVLIKIRIDGKIYERSKISLSVYPELITRIKILSEIDITNKMLPQDGKMKKVINNIEYDLRISTLPTIYGERISIRVLNADNKIMKLEHLGLNNDQLNNIRNILSKKTGMILVCGPTGSGKTTTLYTFLKELVCDNNNIITVEDPVEYSIKGINQVQVNNQSGLSFSSSLRSILRQDPNVIMIGEIRDEETARIAVRASITGHLVLSTLHTNDSLTAITRLIDMKIPDYLVIESISCIISQRLVRKLCDYCKKEEVIDKKDQENYFLKTDKGFKAVGCNFCNKTGYVGRVAVYEMIIFDNELRREIMRSRDFNNIKYLRMASHGFELFYKGVTSLEEIKQLF